MTNEFVESIKKEEPKAPKTKNKSFRLPLEQVRALEDLSCATGISEAQIVIQMIDYCLKGN